MRIRIGLALALLCATSLVLHADPAKKGPEFVVNSHTRGNQMLSRVGRDALGRFTAVWTAEDGDAFGIFGRRFAKSGKPLGKDFLINTVTSGMQWMPDIAVRPTGDFVVVWTSMYAGAPGSSYNPSSVQARRFDSAGRPIDQTQFQVNTHTFMTSGMSAYLQQPAVSSSAAGDFVVAWTLPYGGAAGPVFAKKFGSSGADLTGDFAVNSYTTSGYGLLPDVAMSPAGDFVVVWTSISGQSLNGLRFDAGAQPVKDFQIAQFTSGVGLNASIGMDASSGFVVSWWDLYAPARPIKARLYDSAANPFGPAFQVGPRSTSMDLLFGIVFLPPRISVAPGGRFDVVWSDMDPNAAGLVMVSEHDATGARIGSAPALVAATTADYAFSPDVAMDDEGRFVIVWGEEGADGDDGGILGQRLCSDMDGDTMCDYKDIMIVSPRDYGFVYCPQAPNVGAPPTITWEKGKYDRFRAMISWDPAFPAGQRITSGRKLMRRHTWTPTADQWEQACTEAGGAMLYARVYGVDMQAPSRQRHRTTFSNMVHMDSGLN